MVDHNRQNTVRVQANELKKIALHRFDDCEELRNEWRKERHYYEGTNCQKQYLVCKVFSKMQPFQSKPGNHYSGKSLKSGMEDGGDLSIYPQLGYIEERSIRSRNFSSSPINQNPSLRPLVPHFSNSREEELHFPARMSINYDAHYARESEGAFALALPRASIKPGLMALSPSRSEQPAITAFHQENRGIGSIRKCKTHSNDQENVLLAEVVAAKKTEVSRTQPSTQNGRSRSRL